MQRSGWTQGTSESERSAAYKKLESTKSQLYDEAPAEMITKKEELL